MVCVLHLVVTTSAINGIFYNSSSMLSNLFISLLRKVIPDSVRMPAYIVIVASFVTIIQFLLQGFVPSIYDALGTYIPLIIVNCIIWDVQSHMLLRTQHFHQCLMVSEWDLVSHSYHNPWVQSESYLVAEQSFQQEVFHFGTEVYL